MNNPPKKTKQRHRIDHVCYLFSTKLSIMKRMQKNISLVEDESGGVSFVEYLMLFSIVGIAVAGVFVAMGPGLFRLYELGQFILLSPVS